MYRFNIKKNLFFICLMLLGITSNQLIDAAAPRYWEALTDSENITNLKTIESIEIPVQDPFDIKTGHMFGIKGGRPTNEDQHLFFVNEKTEDCPAFIFMGLFDGHGGTLAAEYAKKHLGNLIKEKIVAILKGPSSLNLMLGLPDAPFTIMEDGTGENREVFTVNTGEKKLTRYGYMLALRRAYLALDKNFCQNTGQESLDEWFQSGSTITGVLIDSLSLYVANAGDSRTIIGYDKSLAFETTDHKPDNASEERRIRAAGGNVKMVGGFTRSKEYVNVPRLCKNDAAENGIAVSRSLGDLTYKTNPPRDLTQLFFDGSEMITSNPDIKDMSKEHVKIIIQVCDGVIEPNITSKEVYDAIYKGLLAGVPLNKACQALTEWAYCKGSEDNISCNILVFGNWYNPIKEMSYEDACQNMGLPTPKKWVSQRPQAQTPIRIEPQITAEEAARRLSLDGPTIPLSELSPFAHQQLNTDPIDNSPRAPSNTSSGNLSNFNDTLNIQPIENEAIQLDATSQENNFGLIAGHKYAIKGRRKTYEDRSILEIGNRKTSALKKYSLITLCDGHGGIKAAGYAQKHLAELIQKHLDLILAGSDTVALTLSDAENDFLTIEDENGPLSKEKKVKGGTKLTHYGIMLALRRAYLELDKCFCNDPKQRATQREHESGTTLSSALLSENNIYLANAGDSRTIVAGRRELKKVTADHKPQNPGEEFRILAAGGSVTNGRVCGDISVSRGIGDNNYKKFDLENGAKIPLNELPFNGSEAITSNPDMMPIPKKDLDFVFQGCDGFFERKAALTNEIICEAIYQGLENGIPLEMICKVLVEWAYFAGNRDNISCNLLVFAEWYVPESTMTYANACQIMGVPASLNLNKKSNAAQRTLSTLSNPTTRLLSEISLPTFVVSSYQLSPEMAEAFRSWMVELESNRQLPFDHEIKETVHLFKERLNSFGLTHVVNAVMEHNISVTPDKIIPIPGNLLPGIRLKPEEREKILEFFSAIEKTMPESLISSFIPDLCELTLEENHRWPALRKDLVALISALKTIKIPLPIQILIPDIVKISRGEALTDLTAAPLDQPQQALQSLLSGPQPTLPQALTPQLTLPDQVIAASALQLQQTPAQVSLTQKPEVPQIKVRPLKPHGKAMFQKWLRELESDSKVPDWLKKTLETFKDPSQAHTLAVHTIVDAIIEHNKTSDYKIKIPREFTAIAALNEHLVLPSSKKDSDTAMQAIQAARQLHPNSRIPEVQTVTRQTPAQEPAVLNLAQLAAERKDRATGAISAITNSSPIQQTARTPQQEPVEGIYFRDEAALQDAIRRAPGAPAVGCILNNKGNNIGVGTVIENGKYIITSADLFTFPDDPWTVVIFPQHQEAQELLAKINKAIEAGKDGIEELNAKEIDLYGRYMNAPFAEVKKVSIFPPRLSKKAHENNLALAQIAWKSRIDGEEIKPPVVGMQCIKRPLNPLDRLPNGVIPTYAPSGVWGKRKQVLQRVVSSISDLCRPANNLVSSRTPCPESLCERLISAGAPFPYQESDTINFAPEDYNSLRGLLLTKTNGSPFLVESIASADAFVIAGILIRTEPLRGNYPPGIYNLVMLLAEDQLDWIDLVVSGAADLIEATQEPKTFIQNRDQAQNDDFPPLEEKIAAKPTDKELEPAEIAAFEDFMEDYKEKLPQKYNAPFTRNTVIEIVNLLIAQRILSPHTDLEDLLSILAFNESEKDKILKFIQHLKSHVQAQPIGSFHTLKRTLRNTDLISKRPTKIRFELNNLITDLKESDITAEIQDLIPTIKAIISGVEDPFTDLPPLEKESADSEIETQTIQHPPQARRLSQGNASLAALNLSNTSASAARAHAHPQAALVYSEAQAQRPQKLEEIFNSWKRELKTTHQVPDGFIGMLTITQTITLRPQEAFNRCILIDTINKVLQHDPTILVPQALLREVILSRHELDIVMIFLKELTTSLPEALNDFPTLNALVKKTSYNTATIRPELDRLMKIFQRGKLDLTKNILRMSLDIEKIASGDYKESEID